MKFFLNSKNDFFAFCLNTEYLVYGVYNRTVLNKIIYQM